MNRLPPELVNLITTTLSSSPIDQLSFLTAHPNHLHAFNQFASSCDKCRFASHFGFDYPKCYPLDFVPLCQVYQGLFERLASGKDRGERLRFQYSLDRRRGFVATDNEEEATWRSRSSWQPRQSKPRTNSKEWARKQITNGTFAFALEPQSDQFVLVHTLNGKHFCSVTKVRLGLEEESSTASSSFHLPYEVMGQDLLLHDRLLFLMPLSKKRNSKQDDKLILLVLDLAKNEGYEEKARFYWPSGRRPPNVYKESGERRLYAYGNRLVQILPCEDIWNLLLYDISQMQLISTVPLKVDPSVIGQLFCADQQGPHLLLAFFGEKHLESNTYPAKVVTFDFEGEASSSAHKELLEVKTANTGRFDLDVPVAHIQLFLCATSDYQIDLGESPRKSSLYHYQDRRIHSRPNRQPLVIFLFPSGHLSSNATYQDLILPLPPAQYPVASECWEHNELLVKDTRVFVMHKIQQRDVVYCTDLNLQLLWTLQVDSAQSLLLQPRPRQQRLFLYASHGCVWLSDAQGCLLVDQEKGLVRGHYSYPKYTRQLPELESLHEDTSPYAQTGFSIWHIQAVKNVLYIVHDIERCSPVILDKITM